MTVAGYAPELLEVFKIGCQKEFRHDCGSEKAAYNLRHRLHKLRREMRKEKHWLLPVAERCVITLDGSFLVARPPDDRIVSDLRQSIQEQQVKK